MVKSSQTGLVALAASLALALALPSAGAFAQAQAQAQTQAPAKPAAREGAKAPACTAPAKPTIPAKASAPTADTLDAFAAAIGKYEQIVETYRVCLDKVLADPKAQPYATWKQALDQYNSIEDDRNAVWDAYDQMWNAYRVEQARLLREAARNTAPPAVVDQTGKPVSGNVGIPIAQ